MPIYKSVAEYYSLWWKTFKEIFWADIDWKGYSIEVFTAFIGGWLFVRQNGWGAVMNNFLDFILFVLAVPGGIAVLYSAYKLMMTPVEILKKQRTNFSDVLKDTEIEFDKTLKDKEVEFNTILKAQELELEKYSWGETVEFEVTPRSIIGMSCWAFRIENKKSFALENVIVEITKIRKDQNITPLSKKHQLGYIDKSNGQIEEKIIYSPDGTRIDIGKRKDFVVTSSREDSTRKAHVFVTYPEETQELAFPFPSTAKESTMSQIANMGSIMAHALYSVRQPEPIVVIRIEVKGEIKTEDEIITLPIDITNLQVFGDGSLDFYYGENENEEENEEN